MAPQNRRAARTYEQLQEVLQSNPHARRMLDAIAMSEGTYGKGRGGYDILFGGSAIPSLEAHPNIRKSFNNPDGGPNYTTAAGRYQFTNSTYSDMAKRLGRPLTFSADDQDVAALALMDTDGALDNVLAGNYGAAAARLGNRWVNLPSATSKQRRWDWKDFDNALQRAGATDYPRPAADAPAPPSASRTQAAASQPRGPGLSLDNLPLMNLPGPFAIPQQMAFNYGGDLFDAWHPPAGDPAPRMSMPPTGFAGGITPQMLAMPPQDTRPPALLGDLLPLPLTAGPAIPTALPPLVDWEQQRQRIAPEATWLRQYLDTPVPRTPRDILDQAASSPPPPLAQSLDDPGPLAAALRALALEQSVNAPPPGAGGQPGASVDPMPEAAWLRQSLDMPVPRTPWDILSQTSTPSPLFQNLGDPGPLAAALRARAYEQSINPVPPGAENLFVGGLAGALVNPKPEFPEVTVLPPIASGAPRGGNPFSALPNAPGWGGQGNRLAGDPWLFPAARAGVAPVIDLTPTFDRRNVGPRDARGMNDRLFNIAQQMNAADNVYRNVAGQTFDPHPTYWDDRFRQLLDLTPEELQRLSNTRRLTTTRAFDERG